MTLAQGAQQRVGRVLEGLARGLAYFGGLLLVAIGVITVASIIGRSLAGIGLGPITGDFELVEAGCAIAVFCFLPLTQMRRAHVTVDILSRALPPRVQAALGVLGDCAITLASGVIGWRLWLGFGEKFPYGSDALRGALQMGYKPFYAETTYELQLPLWIPYALSVVGAALFFLVSLYTMWRSLNWVLAGREGVA